MSSSARAHRASPETDPDELPNRRAREYGCFPDSERLYPMTAPTADPADLSFAIDLAIEAGSSTLQWFQQTALTVDYKTTVLKSPPQTRQRSRWFVPGSERFPPMGSSVKNTTTSTGTRVDVRRPDRWQKAFKRPAVLDAIALIDEYGPAIGVIHLPGLGETVAVGRGLGATLNGSRVGSLPTRDSRVPTSPRVP